MATARPNRKDNPTENTVQLARSRAGVIVVVAGDVVIALAAFIGIIKFSSGGVAGASMVAILTSAFTAISTMTTAYFGIKTISNTAQSFARQMPAAGSGSYEQVPPGDAPGSQPAAAGDAGDAGEPPADGDQEPHSAM
jgi:hypothetical protein